MQRGWGHSSGVLSATAPAYQPLSRVWNSSHFTPNQWHIHLLEVKYCEDTRARSQLEAACKGLQGFNPCKLCKAYKKWPQNLTVNIARFVSTFPELQPM